jgi:hypothetical protein
MNSGVLYQGLCQKGEIVFRQETLLIGNSGKHVNEGSGKGQLSPWGYR